jgi:hypothetical protein
MVLQLVRNRLGLSFLRRPESSDFSMFWMPDQVRHDEFGIFTDHENLEIKSFGFFQYRRKNLFQFIRFLY